MALRGFKGFQAVSRGLKGFEGVLGDEVPDDIALPVRSEGVSDAKILV